MGDEERTEAKPAPNAAPATSDAAPNSPPEAEADEKLTVAEARGWKGFRLDDLAGGSVGKIVDVYVDEQSGEPEWLLARMGRFGHHCLVPARDAVGAVGHVWVPYSRDQIRKAPRMDAGEPLKREAEEALLTHYGVGTSVVGRGADLAKRDASAVTARAAQQ